MKRVDSCGSCGQWMGIEGNWAGLAVKCPKCGSAFVVKAGPSPAPAAAAPPTPSPQPAPSEAVRALPPTPAPAERTASPPVPSRPPNPAGFPWPALLPLGLPLLATALWLAGLPALAGASGAVWVVAWLAVGVALAAAGFFLPRRRPGRLGTALGLTAAGCAGLGVALPFAAGGPSPPIDAAAWQEVVAADGRFRLLMPGEPEIRVQQVAGMRGPLTVLGVERKREDAAFFLSHGEIEPWDLERVPLARRFAEARDGMLANTPGGRCVAERPIDLDGAPGREFILEVPGKGTLVARAYAAGRRWYVLLAAGRGYQPDTPDVRKFHDSFRLINPSPPPATRLRGLAGYWPFEEGQGEKAADASGRGQPAAVRGARWVKGVRGTALQFDGDGEVDFGTSRAFGFAAEAPFTVAAWVKVKDIGHAQQGVVFSQHDSRDNTPRFSVEVFRGVLRVLMRDEGDRRRSPGVEIRAGGIDDDEWHHFAVARTAAGTVRVFFDGRAVQVRPAQKAPGGLSADRRRLAVGGFKGAIDEFCVFRRVLTAFEVECLAGKVEAPQWPNDPPEPPPARKDEPLDPSRGRFRVGDLTVVALAFTPDSAALVTGTARIPGGQSGEVMVWDLAQRKARKSLPGDGWFQLAAGRYLLHALPPGANLEVYDLARETLKIYPLEGRTKYGRFFALSPDARTLVAADGTSVRRFDFERWSLKETWPTLARASSLLTFSPDGTVFAGVENRGLKGGGTAHVCSAESGEVLFSLPHGGGDIASLTFSPDGKTLFTLGSGSSAPTVKFWDVKKGTARAGLAWAGRGRYEMAVSPDGKYLATGSGTGTILVWDTEAREVKATLDTGNCVGCLAFSPDGKTLAAGVLPTPGQYRGPSDVRLWDFPELLRAGAKGGG